MPLSGQCPLRSPLPPSFELVQNLQRPWHSSPAQRKRIQQGSLASMCSISVVVVVAVGVNIQLTIACAHHCVVVVAMMSPHRPDAQFLATTDLRRSTESNASSVVPLCGSVTKRFGISIDWRSRPLMTMWSNIFRSWFSSFRIIEHTLNHCKR